MNAFLYQQPASRVVFGFRSLERLADEVARLDCARALVLSTPEQRSDAHAACERLGAPLSLREIGMPADGLDRAARLATENPYFNPQPIDYPAIRTLLEHAYHGCRPD